MVRELAQYGCRTAKGAAYTDIEKRGVLIIEVVCIDEKSNEKNCDMILDNLSLLFGNKNSWVIVLIFEYSQNRVLNI